MAGQDWRSPQCSTLRKWKEFQKRFDCVNKHSSGNISFITLFLDFQMVFILRNYYLFMILPKEGNKLKADPLLGGDTTLSSCSEKSSGSEIDLSLS